MDYAGAVDADGPRIERTDGAVHVRKFSVEAMDNNVYVVACARTGAALVVDAAARPERILAETEDLRVEAVVQTHGHWDHTRAWDALVDEHGWRVWGHPGDRDLFPREADRWLRDDEVLAVGDLEVRVLHTPGHTPGACQFLVHGDRRAHLFTGDSLFPGGPGRTTSTQHFDELMGALESRVFGALPDDTWIYPGHGDDTTLGTERVHVPEWWARGW